MACGPNRARLLCMLALTFGFFVVEVVVSRITSSLSMLSDSFHMLSDVLALVVALVAVRFAERTHSTKKNTFGWIRAEVMGALVNAIFLTALCFTIVLEAIERFTEPQEIDSPMVVVWVGAAGLLVNVLGLLLFHGHAGGGHSHGGNSHGDKGKKGKTGKTKKLKNAGDGLAVEETNNLVASHNSPGDGRSKTDVSSKDNTEVQMNGNTQIDDDHDSSAQLNMRGVFLHVLGDALGSVIVVVNSLIFTFVWKPCTDKNCVNPCIKSRDEDLHQAINRTGKVEMAGPCWVLYLDPSLCLIMVGILLYTTYPLLKESALILLQTVPKQVNIKRLNERLLSLDGVLAIHDLHIWQLAGSRIIATAHIKCRDPTSYMEVAKRIKDFFHDEGIHATTIQPEFVTFSSQSRDSLCELSCRTQCAPKLCCETADKQKGGVDSKAAAATAASSAVDVVNETLEQAPVIQVSSQTDAKAAVRKEVESSL
ncbi:PREDICTED: zinc transporter 1 [Poecilia mexicana]|uniref:Solute carrier family 30 member 1a n=2 Tax=Poecilia TaxID=8080 RepID=A0A087YMF9_POEFO|nr:PREDICTED: zinc transporter 1 [Poecilia formosa]XP_014854494.1 PREDICTED: zinc transporter 1 [Poecilia mexicana]